MSAARFRPGIDLPAEQITANRRYWESEESVNGIADAMGISKGRLYDLLLPFDADLACRSCGGALGFPHRTARLRGEVTCDRCGFSASRDDVVAGEAEGGNTAMPESPGGSSSAGGEPAASRAEAPPELWTPGSATTPVSQQTLAGALLAGLAVGIVIGAWLRR
jgi:hypothetical protein